MKITFKFSYFKKDWAISHEQAQGLTELRLSNSFHLHRAGIHAPWRSTPYPVSTRSLIVAGSRHLTSERAVTYPAPQPSASRPRCPQLERLILVLGDEPTALNCWSILKKSLNLKFLPKAPNLRDPVRFLMLSSGFWEGGRTHYSRHPMGINNFTTLSWFCSHRSLLQFELRCWVDYIVSEQIQKSRTSRWTFATFLSTFRFI